MEASVVVKKLSYGCQLMKPIRANKSVPIGEPMKSCRADLADESLLLRPIYQSILSYSVCMTLNIET